MSTPSTRRAAAAAAFYTPLATANCPARRVGWSTEAGHLLRLRAIIDAVAGCEPLAHVASILDAGCGEARLLDELRSVGWRGHYRGEDILPAMVTRAQAQHPKDDIVNADAWAGGPSAAVVVCSGALNTPSGESDPEELRKALDGLWQRAKQALIFDIAVADRHRGEGLNLADLETVWRLARELAPVVTVREDLIPGEALIIMQRDRRNVLKRLLPGAEGAVARAEIHLAANEPAAARLALAGSRAPRADIWRAAADAATGRVRDAELRLRRVAASEDEARLHLGMLLCSTRRHEEGNAHLRALIDEGGARSDEARLQLARALRAQGAAAPVIVPLLNGIRDPWIQRAAKTLNDELKADLE